MMGKINIPAIFCVGWILLHVGMAIGTVGQQIDAGTYGWSDVFVIAFIPTVAAISAFMAGRASK